MPEYSQFTATQFAPSTTPPTPFTAPAAAAPAAPVEFNSDAFDPTTTPPTQFGSSAAVLADYAALRAVTTPTLALGTVRQVAAATAGEEIEVWQLGAGTDADAPAAGKIRPTDYQADTNARIWSRTL